MATVGQAQSCCRSEPVAHMKKEAVPTSFLELPRRDRKQHLQQSQHLEESLPFRHP